MNHVFTRKLEDRPVITLNKKLQPVAESSKIRAELSSFMGTLARQCVPLDYINWSVVPESHKNSWWEYVQTKYIIPEEGKGWVLRTMTELWRIHKSRVKAEYYTKYSTDVERLQNRPDSILLEKFKVLLEYWGDEDVQTKAVTNAGNRKKVTDVHNAGHTSFAQIGKNMKNKKKIPQTPRKRHIYPKLARILLRLKVMQQKLVVTVKRKFSWTLMVMGQTSWLTGLA
ncbi:uncharacterized protein LOC141676612 [Apium graveolens]|uniref:uncharacterized protein LOC141676612 n=1 Tax=Apium graveolens TaxID=4045 RepID=UPI003D7B78F5